MKYQCNNRFVSSSRHHYRIDDYISNDEYAKLTNTEKDFFTKVPEPFAEQLSDNIIKDEELQNS